MPSTILLWHLISPLLACIACCTVILVYSHLLLNTLQCSAKCLKYIKILTVSLEWVRDWGSVYINKWGKEDLHVIAAESWFHNLTRIAFSKTLSFYMLWTEASMNKVFGDLMDWRKLKIWHQTCPEKWDNLLWGILTNGFSKEHSYHQCCLEDFPTHTFISPSEQWISI